MNIAAHTEFPKDQVKYWSDYSGISDRVAAHFQQQVDETGAGYNHLPFGSGTFLPHRQTTCETLAPPKF